MPTSYPAEFRRRAIALVRSSWSVTKTAHDLDVTTTTIYNWVKQDRIDRGEIPSVSTKESKELVRAHRRIRSRATASRTLNSSPMNSIHDREKDLTGRLLRNVSMLY